jgi:O-antigen/teichoic acid export membrane protein
LRRRRPAARRRAGSQASAAGRGIWSLLDQSASSLSNYALFIAVARTAGVDGLGAFSVAYAVYAIVLGTVRALSSDALIVRYSDARVTDLAEAGEATTGFGLLSGVVVGLILVAVGVAVGGRVGAPLAALGVVLPGLLVQDACRFVFIAGRRPRDAFANDAVWLVLQLAGITALVARGHPSVYAQVLAWGLAGTAAAAFGLGQLRLLPAPLWAARWAQAQRDIGLPFGGAFLVDRGSSQLGFTLVGAIGGLGTLGALTAARALFAPVTTVLSAASSFAVAEGTRLRGARLTIRRYAWFVAVALAALPIVLGAVLYLGPQQLGRVLVGRSWPAAHTVLVPMALFSAALAATLGPWTGLKVIQAARATFGTKLVIAPISVAAPLVGDHFWGVQGAAYGLVFSGLVALALWAWVFEARMRQPVTRPSRLGSVQINPRGGLLSEARGGSQGKANGKAEPGVPGAEAPREDSVARRAEAIFAALQAPGGAASGAGPAIAAGADAGMAAFDRTEDPVIHHSAMVGGPVEPHDVTARLFGIEQRLTGIEQALQEVLERLDTKPASGATAPLITRAGSRRKR